MSACGSCGGEVGHCRCQRFVSGGRSMPALERATDRARDVLARLGFRPYRVKLVHVRWTGGRQLGDGVEEVVVEREILPVPSVGDLSGVIRSLTAAQVDEQGTVILTKISASYTEDQILCRPENGRPLPPNEAVYYEIQYKDGQRRRLTPVGGGAPSFFPARAEWQVVLQVQRGARSRSGANR